MVRVTVLGSGSRGNSTLLSAGEISILIDAGLSCREIIRRLRLAGEDIQRLSAILITHEHQDHVQGLGVLARKLQIPVYMTGATHRAWEKWVRPSNRMTYAKWVSKRAAENSTKAPLPEAAVAVAEVEPIAEDLTQAAVEMASTSNSDATREVESDQLELEGTGGKVKDPAELPALEYFTAGLPFQIGPIRVNSFTIPHDAADPVGFVFQAEGVRVAVATDLGYVPTSVRKHLQGCDCLMIESNHDLEMLRYGPYPWSVKQRVMSRVGHLSNDALAQFLTTDYDGNASFVILAHISESNNHPELVRNSAERALGGRQTLLANHLVLAKQDEPLEPIRF